MNAQNYEHEQKNFEHERSKICWTHKLLDMNSRKTDQKQQNLGNATKSWHEHKRVLFMEVQNWKPERKIVCWWPLKVDMHAQKSDERSEFC